MLICVEGLNQLVRAYYYFVTSIFPSNPRSVVITVKDKSYLSTYLIYYDYELIVVG